jgi:uncharacterized protein with HEPN domain
MRPKRVYIDYLRDMASAAEKAQSFTAGLDFSSLRRTKRPYSR